MHYGDGSKLRIAWRAYIAELGVMQRLERPSEAVIAERARRYFQWRLEEALEVLGSDSSALAEVLNEMEALLIRETKLRAGGRWHSRMRTQG